MRIKPRVDADHHLVLSTLAFLALDRPDFSDVLRSLVVTLYGVRAVAVYEAIQQQFEPAPGARRQQLPAAVEVT